MRLERLTAEELAAASDLGKVSDDDDDGDDGGGDGQSDAPTRRVQNRPHRLRSSP